MSIDLGKDFSGEVIKPGDADYESASTIMVRQGSPALIVFPRTAADVATAVTYGVDQHLTISVKSGGHSNAGFSTNDGGLVIDLKHFSEVSLIDKAQHLVRIGTGAKWIDVAKELESYGLALSSGDTTSVGVGGLLLGGGVGWMVRKYGLTIDSLVSAEVVTADGRILQVSADENADLFWGIRGGGGNLGIVTNVVCEAHPIGKVFAGTVIFKLEHLAELIKGWRDYMRTAPRELTTVLLMMPPFGDRPASVMIICCYAGDNHDAAMTAIDPLTTLGTVVTNNVTEKDYADVLEEAKPPRGVKIFVNNAFVDNMSDELIDVISRQHNAILQIRGLGGALGDTATDATAFAHRGAEALIVAPTFVPLTASEQDIEKALQPWREIEAFGTGAYINFFSHATEEAIAASYPEPTYKRLVELKKQYDPQNIFNQNINIKP